MNKIDSEGTYIFEVVEQGVSETQASGLPQVVTKAKAVQKFIGDLETMEHFKLTEAGYVDWSEYDETIITYSILYGKDGNKLLNYEQLEKAFGWLGDDLTPFFDGSYIGKQFLGRVENQPYNGKDQLKVAWIDAPDADPSGSSLKLLDAEGVKALNAKLGLGKKQTVAKAPAAKPPSSTPTKPGGKAPASPTSSAKPPVPITSSAKPPTTAKATPPKATPKPAVETSLPEDITKDDAWAYLISHRGDNDENFIADGWGFAVAEVESDSGHTSEDSTVAGNNIPATFTGKDWAKVRDTVIKDADLK